MHHVDQPSGKGAEPAVKPGKRTNQGGTAIDRKHPEGGLTDQLEAAV